MTIESELNLLDNTKAAIKQAIIDKGVAVPTNTSFSEYPSKIAQIETGSEPELDSITITPSTTSQTIVPPTGVDGYDDITVSAVTAAIDADIVAGNIKSGVEILGVAGTVVELAGETATVTPSTTSQTITPTGTSNGLTEVTVEAVTSAIDADIVAGNIKAGVSILGVTGDYAGEAPTLETLTVTPTTTSQTLTPTSGTDGFDEVVVSAVTSSIDPDIVAGNIKQGVEILGVTGTYAGEAPVLQTKTVTVTSSSPTLVTTTADSGYDGLDEVTTDLSSVVTLINSL